MGSNPTVWWILEGAKPGYWADSENRFIYETSDRDENGNSIFDMIERLIYYATLCFSHVNLFRKIRLLQGSRSCL